MIGASSSCSECLQRNLEGDPTRYIGTSTIGLRNRTESEIEERYTTDFLWAISTTKEHLWEFMQAEGLFVEPIDLIGGIDLLHSLDRFFDCILYFAAVGYQNARQIESEQARHGHAIVHI